MTMNAQEQILDVFSQKNIEKVIYVDDILGKVSYHDNVFGKVATLVNQGIWDQQYPFTMETDLWQELFEEWWENAAFEEIEGFAKKYGVERTNPSIANKLQDMLSICNVELLSPEQFDDDYKKDLLNQMKEAQKVCMVLIDYDLKGFEKNGDQMLESIANDDNIFCGVFSEKFGVDEEIKKWEERQFNKNIYPISKKRFDGDDEALIIQGIKNVIWLKQIEKIKEMASDIVDSACDSLHKGLKEIDPATFNRMVIASSKAEGCWEFDALSRIIMIYFNIGMRQGMKDKFPCFQQKTNSIRALNGPNQSEIVNDNVIDMIKEDEWYEEIEYVNKVYSPVSNGDIFQIGKKYYILLGQPCNLSIRPEGKRGYNLDQAFLLPLTTKDKAEEKMSLNDGLVGRFQHPFEKEYSYILFGDWKRVSLSLLDLVSYNANGLAEIDINVSSDHLEGKEIMQDNMLLRYDKILEKIVKYKDACDTIDNKLEKQQKPEILRFFCKSYEMGDEKVVKKPTISETNIKFDVKRIGRYNSYGAHVLLQQFMSYMSRPEFPGDLGRC